MKRFFGKFFFAVRADLGAVGDESFGTFDRTAPRGDLEREESRGLEI